jgi:hypothetical protein
MGAEAGLGLGEERLDIGLGYLRWVVGKYTCDHAARQGRSGCLTPAPVAPFDVPMLPEARAVVVAGAAGEGAPACDLGAGSQVAWGPPGQAGGRLLGQETDCRDWPDPGRHLLYRACGSGRSLHGAAQLRLRARKARHMSIMPAAG